MDRAKGAGLKIVVIGSSVALGHKAWLLNGWSWLLGQTLQPSGHQLVNVGSKEELAQERQRWQQPSQISLYVDPAGFQISTCVEEKQV